MIAILDTFRDHRQREEHERGAEVAQCRVATVLVLDNDPIDTTQRLDEPPPKHDAEALELVRLFRGKRAGVEKLLKHIEVGVIVRKFSVEMRGCETPDHQ